MKQLLSFFCAVLVAITALGQTSPPNKLRSNDSFTQVDNYLVAAKRLGIPTGDTPTLNAATSAQNSAKLFYNTTDESLYVYDVVGEIWNPVSADIDLSEYYTIAQVDSAITASSPFNLIDVTQVDYTDKAINVKAFNNAGMSYSEGSIDFGVTRGSPHTMGLYAFKQGEETTASGDYSLAFGYQTTASGPGSSAFGYQTTSSGIASTAIGYETIASGVGSTAFGRYSTASGEYSSAFGFESEASGNRSSAFGSHSRASGYASSALGGETTSSGIYSSAFGFGTTANEYAALAIGRFSTDGAAQTSWTPGSPIFKVGNGDDVSTRSNAYVLYNDGTSTQYGIASYGADYSANFTDRSLVDKAYVDSKASPFNLIDVTQQAFTDKAINVIAFNNSDNGMTYQEGSIDFGVTRGMANAHQMGLYAIKANFNSRASGDYSAAFGNGRAEGDFSFAVGSVTTASGENSMAGGRQTTASAARSFAFGDQITVSGVNSLGIGLATIASGENSAALGNANSATGLQSTAAGFLNTSSGDNSTVFGHGNIANEYASLAIGRFSTGGAAQDSWVTNAPVFKVGNGTSGESRSNAYVLYNDGRSEQVKDIEVTEIGQGVVLKSPDGTRWRITVDNSGNLTTTAL